MSSEGDSSKKGGGWGWSGVGDFKQLGASLQSLGKNMEEKLNANSVQFQQQPLNVSKHGLGGSKHGLGGSKHGLGGSKHGSSGGFMPRLQLGLSNVAVPLSTQEEENGTPVKSQLSPDPFPNPDTPFKTPAKDEPSFTDTATTSFQSPSESNNDDESSTLDNKTTTPLLSSRSPDDVSKEELLEILKKMNTRVKALAASRVQLMDKVKLAERDKSRLVSLLKNEIVGEADYLDAVEKVEKFKEEHKKKTNNDGATVPIDEVTVMQSAWRMVDERNQMNLQHIQNEYKVMTMQAQAELEKVRKSVTEEKDMEIHRMKEDMKEALSNVQADTGFLPNREETAGDAGELLLQKESEIESLKDELNSLKDKFKAHHTQFEEKAMIELNKAKDEAAAAVASRNEMEANIASLNNETLAHQEFTSPDLLRERDEKIKQLEESIEHLKPLHAAELERVKNESTQQQDELNIKMNDELRKANEPARLVIEGIKSDAKTQQEEAVKRVEADASQRMTEQLTQAVMSAKMEAIAELKSSLEADQQNTMDSLKQYHEEHRTILERKHATEIEELKSASDLALDELRNKEAARVESEIERIRLAIHTELSRDAESKISQIHTIHKSELEQLREKLSHEIRGDFEQRHAAEVRELKTAHLAEFDLLKSDLIASSHSSHEDELNNLQQRHQQEMEGIRSEIEAAVAAKSRDDELNRISENHQAELEMMKDEFQSKSLAELQRAQSVAEQHHFSEIASVSAQLTERHAKELKKLKTVMLSLANSSQSEQLEQIISMHKDEMTCMRSELESAAAQSRSALENQLSALNGQIAAALTAVNRKLKNESSSELSLLEQQLHMSRVEVEEVVKQLDATNAKFRSELEQFNRSRDEQHAALLRQHDHRLKSMEKKINEIHSQELESLKADMVETVKESGSEELERIIALHKQEIDDLRSELESAAAESRSTLENQLSALRGQITALSSERGSLEQQLIIFREEKEAAEEQIKVINVKHLADMEQFNKSRDEERAALSLQYENQLKSAEERLNVKHSHEIQRLKAEMMESSRSEDLDHIISSYERKIADMRSQHETAALESRSAFESQIAILHAQIESVSTQKEDVAKSLLSERSSFEVNIQSLKDQYEEKLCELEERLKAQESKLISDIQHLKATYDEERCSLHRCHDDQMTSMQQDLKEQQKARELIVVEFEETKLELEHLKTELVGAEKKAAQTFQMANKIKNAASEKLKSLTAEHADTIAEVEKSNAQKLGSLQAELDSEIKSTEDSRKEVEELKSSLESTRIQHNTALMELEVTKKAASTGLDNKLKQLAENQASTIAQLNQDHDEAVARIQSDHKNAVSKMQTEHQLSIDEQGKENAANKAKLQQMMAKNADELKDHYEKKCNVLKEENAAVVKRMKEESDEIKSKIKSLTNELATQRSEGELLRNSLRDRATKEKSMLDHLEKLKSELSNVSKTASTSANAMLEEQGKLELQIKEMRAKNEIFSNQNEELTGKLKALSGNLAALAEDKKDADEKLEHSAKLIAKFKGAEFELNNLRQENNALKLDQTKTNSILAKLNQERDDNERKHGQRTALVGMLEEQVADLNDSLSEAKAELEATAYDVSQRSEEIESLKRDLERASKSLKIAETKAEKSATASQQNNEKDLMQKSLTIKSLQSQIESIQNQMKKKSFAAQKLLKEREVECMELRKANKFLQNEIDKGTLSDKRIFELAAQQSNRETAGVVEIEIRDTLVAHLTEKLEKYDGDLACAELYVEKAEDQVESLSRLHRREGVNMDYLKSIVVQYLAKPPGSSERAALLPVLATLLQFDDNDYKSIEEGKQKVSWWGDIIPTYITGPEVQTGAPRSSPPDQHTAPLLPTSAEVTISNKHSQIPTKKTSLQF